MNGHDPYRVVFAEQSQSFSDLRTRIERCRQSEVKDLEELIQSAALHVIREKRRERDLACHLPEILRHGTQELIRNSLEVRAANMDKRSLNPRVKSASDIRASRYW